MEMKYNIEWLLDKYDNGDKLEYIFFWGHQPSKDGSITKSCLSQWWVSPFEVIGNILDNTVKYKTAEHWMMAQKALLFGDTDTYEKIIYSKTPKEAKVLGREVRNFNEDIWITKRYEIVLKGSLHKFFYDKNLAQYLVSTGDKILVEASPYDKIWGIGMDVNTIYDIENPNNWKGLNLLGFALMEARDTLVEYYT